MKKQLKLILIMLDAHNNLGVIFQELGEIQKAKECYEKAIEIDPNYADAYNNLQNQIFNLKSLKVQKIIILNF